VDNVEDGLKEAAMARISANDIPKGDIRLLCL
jgi:hypothetical protein